MQLIFFSVEKSPFSTPAVAFAPKKGDIGTSLLRMSRTFLKYLPFIRQLPLHDGSASRTHRQHFPDPTGSNATSTPDRNKTRVFVERIGDCGRCWIIIFDSIVDRNRFWLSWNGWSGSFFGRNGDFNRFLSNWIRKVLAAIS